MKILIVSDTHGWVENLEKVLKKTGHIDCLIHLGDVTGDEDYIRSLTDAPVHIVAGNNDYGSKLPQEEILEIGGYKALLTHGHYYVGAGIGRLQEEALARGVDIVMFGHTHFPCLWQKDGLTILNPGSLSLPRQEGRRPSYIIMEIDRAGAAHFTICYLKAALDEGAGFGRWFF